MLKLVFSFDSIHYILIGQLNTLSYNIICFFVFFMTFYDFYVFFLPTACQHISNLGLRPYRNHSVASFCKHSRYDIKLSQTASSNPVQNGQTAKLKETLIVKLNLKYNIYIYIYLHGQGKCSELQLYTRQDFAGNG